MMYEPRPTHAYTGTLPCGCIVAVCMDEPRHQRDVAKSVGDYIRRGYEVNRRPIADIKDDPAFLRNCGGEYHKRRRAETAQMGAGL